MAFSAITKPSLHFNSITWSGNDASPRAMTGVGFQPDLCWSKTRGSAKSHQLIDSARGVTKTLSTNTDSAEGSSYGNGFLQSFDSDGFTSIAGSSATTNWNGNGLTYVGWNWKAGGTGSSNSDGSTTATISADTTVGFSIVSWTGTGSATTLGHGLSATPQVILVKNRSEVYGWQMYHPGLGGNNKYISINSTDAVATDTASWNNTAPTSSVFSVGASDANNKNTNNIIAYCYAEKKGYSKFGSYIGNGNANGTFVYTGFKPAWLLYKNITSASQWRLYDSSRNTFNPVTRSFRANSTNAEATGSSAIVDFLSNGFKQKSGNYTDSNQSGHTYIYMTFAEHPFVGDGTNPVTAR